MFLTNDKDSEVQGPKKQGGQHAARGLHFGHPWDRAFVLLCKMWKNYNDFYKPQKLIKYAFMKKISLVGKSWVATRIFRVHFLVAFSKYLPWLQPTNVITLKTQPHAVDALWKWVLQRSFNDGMVFNRALRSVVIVSL